MSFERDARCKHGNVLPGGDRCTDCDLEEEVELVRSYLVNLTDEQRVKFFEAIERGFCRACGRARGDRICHCENDE